jgi:hypothetical protein
MTLILSSSFFLQRYGASTLVLDNRIFVSFNPFDVYVTQADVKPGCVLRAANVVQALQGRGLLTDEEVRSWSGAAEILMIDVEDDNRNLL